MARGKLAIHEPPDAGRARSVAPVVAIVVYRLQLLKDIGLRGVRRQFFGIRQRRTTVVGIGCVVDFPLLVQLVGFGHKCIGHCDQPT